MITLTNRAVRDDLYEILNVLSDSDMWVASDGDGWRISIRNNETTTTSYPYPNRVSAEKDYFELKRIKNLCKQ
jgi:hypothetical protein